MGKQGNILILEDEESGIVKAFGEGAEHYREYQNGVTALSLHFIR